MLLVLVEKESYVISLKLGGSGVIFWKKSGKWGYMFDMLICNLSVAIIFPDT